MLTAIRRILGLSAPQPVAPPVERPLVTYTSVEPTYASEAEERYQTWGITR